MHYFDFQSRGRGQVVRLMWEVSLPPIPSFFLLPSLLPSPSLRSSAPDPHQSLPPPPKVSRPSADACVQDAGIAYEDVRYTFAEYPEAKNSTIKQLNPTGSIPVIELNGKILTQSYAILRHFARLLGKYDGATEDERYWADAMCDIAIDCTSFVSPPLLDPRRRPRTPSERRDSRLARRSTCIRRANASLKNPGRTLFITAFFSPDKAKTYPAHQSGDRDRFLSALETHLTTSDLSRRGPFVIGKEVTYADLVIYQVCHDENLTQDGAKGLKDYPRLKQMVEAVEGREGVGAFLRSERYLG